MTSAVILAAMIIAAPGYGAEMRDWPVDSGTVTSRVGWRKDPFGSKQMSFHRGWDISVPTGTPVFPLKTGTVSYAGKYKGYGNMVMVDHGDGSVSMYGHNSKIAVTVGQAVGITDVIAYSGNTGRSTGPHVHVEWRYWGDNQRRAHLTTDKSRVSRNHLDESGAPTVGVGGEDDPLTDEKQFSIWANSSESE